MPIYETFQKVQSIFGKRFLSGLLLNYFGALCFPISFYFARFFMMQKG